MLAHNLTPSETANLNRKFVRGFVTEIGGPGSHTAIVAEGLEIPAVVGTGPFLTDVSGGDLVIIDGDQGLVILQPDEETLARYRHEAEQQHQPRRASWKRSATCRPKRPTACAIELLGNIEFPHEVAAVHRTAAPTASACIAPSSCTWAPNAEPDEEVHYRGLRRGGAARWPGKPVVIRTLDLGADKVPARRPRTSRNPVPGPAQHSAVAARTCRCFARSCGPCCGPARWATCG